MPNFETHRKINYFILLLISICYLYFDLDRYLHFNIRIIETFFVTYILGTELFTPDLDIKSKPSKRLGFIYLPIRWIFHHRGKLHSIFFGWIIQTIYLILIWIIILILVNKLGYNIDLSLKNVSIDYIVGFVAGLSLSNGIHIIADRL